MATTGRRMRGSFPGWLAILCSLALAGCLAQGAGGAKPKAGANPIAGDAIEVTSLDPVPLPGADAAKPGAKPGTPPKPPKPGEKPAAAPAADAVQPAGPDTPRPKPRPGEAAAAPDADTIAAPEAAPADPGTPKSAAQIACEKKKGAIWVKAGKSGASACVKRTKDAGKQCNKGSDCEGECLARSRTCSPYDPLFGCNEILQDDGRRMTLCLD